jgi:hypothetical protein
MNRLTTTEHPPARDPAPNMPMSGMLTKEETRDNDSGCHRRIKKHHNAGFSGRSAAGGPQGHVSRAVPRHATPSLARRACMEILRSSKPAAHPSPQRKQGTPPSTPTLARASGLHGQTRRLTACIARLYTIQRRSFFLATSRNDRIAYVAHQHKRTISWKKQRYKQCSTPSAAISMSICFLKN